MDYRAVIQKLKFPAKLSALFAKLGPARKYVALFSGAFALVFASVSLTAVVMKGKGGGSQPALAHKTEAKGPDAHDGHDAHASKAEDAEGEELADADDAEGSEHGETREPAAEHSRPAHEGKKIDGETARAAAPGAQPAQPGGVKGILKPVVDAFDSVQRKIERIREAEEENTKLRLENANLRLKTETLQFDCHAKDAASVTRELEIRFGKDTGHRAGRSLANIGYRPPVHLLPPQLYTLAVSYFKGREDEKAAVILTLLTDMEENDAYKTGKNYVMAGVSWYRLDNLELADKYFAKALEPVDPLKPSHHDSAEMVPYQAQARLWRALVAERMNRHNKAQYWLRELIDHHPHSTESGWVNQESGHSPNAKESARVPASH